MRKNIRVLIVVAHCFFATANAILYSSPEDVVPAFDTESSVPIVFASDHNYAIVTGVAISSLRECASPSNFYDIWILDSGMSQEDRDMLSILNGDNFRLRHFDISPILTDYLRAVPQLQNGFHGWKLIIYSKFLIPELFHAYPKVLGLDGDMIIKTDVAELFSIDLEGKPLAGVNWFGSWNRGEPRIKPGDPSPWQEVNAGVYIYDTERLNAFEFSRKALESLASNPETEEYIISKMLQIKLLPYEWNSFASDRIGTLTSSPDSIKNARILHFQGKTKPWRNTYKRYPRYKDWWHVAFQSPFREEIRKQYLRPLFVPSWEAMLPASVRQTLSAAVED